MPVLPARGAAVRTLDLPLPPARMPLVRAGRPLKRWRYVGVYGPEVCLCAAEAWMGPLAQRFWGLATPDGRLLSARSVLGAGGVAVGESAMTIRARGGKNRARVEVDAELARDAATPAVETVSPSGERGYVWTRKRAGVPVRAAVAHRTRLGPVRSDYRQPFGSFAGTLPGGLELTEGYGVMERHEAWW